MARWAKTITRLPLPILRLRCPDSARDRRPLLVLRERLQDQLPQRVLRRDVDQGPEQREGASLAVHAIGPRRERDVPPVAPSALPHGESDQLQASERSVAVAEVQFGFG